MGIKLITRTTYRADSGRVFELENMQPSHLLNVIHHHRNQVDSLVFLINAGYDDKDKQFLMSRLKALETTLEALGKELASRDPVLDDNNGDDYEE